MAYGSSKARGQIGATAAGLHHSHSNAGSLTQWAKPGIEPQTSWFLVGFVSAAPRWELPYLEKKKNKMDKGLSNSIFLQQSDQIKYLR